MPKESPKKEKKKKGDASDLGAGVTDSCVLDAGD